MTLLKSLVLGLVLANAAYFLWTSGIGQTQAVAVVSPAPMTLKLASEVATPTAADSAVIAHPESDSGAGVGMRCVTVGPFKDVSAAAHAASTLRSGGYDPRQRVVDGDVWAGVWVYLPIPPTHAASEQMLAKLKAGGIEDALEMPGPADGSVISLGVFGEQKRAQSRVAQAQALGFNPALADRKRAGTVYWIDLDLKAGDGALNPADLQGEAGHISRVQIKACPAAAAAT